VSLWALRLRITNALISQASPLILYSTGASRSLSVSNQLQHASTEQRIFAALIRIITPSALCRCTSSACIHHTMSRTPAPTSGSLHLPQFLPDAIDATHFPQEAREPRSAKRQIEVRARVGAVSCCECDAAAARQSTTARFCSQLQGCN